MYHGYQTNSVYPNFPPLMADGRSITASYNPNAVQTETIIQENGIKTSWDYRNFMTRNSEKIREFNYLDSLNEFGYTKTPADLVYGKPVSVGAQAVATPYIYTGVKDNFKQPRNAFAADSDLKKMYLSREQLNARKVAPVWQPHGARIAPI
jgi:hypothetical protein